MEFPELSIERLFVIQEHNAERAGLHWDIRFEDYNGKKRFLRSFVIPKHRFPKAGEKLLTISVADHNFEYGSFEGELTEGYGKGTVKLVHYDVVRVWEYNDDKIKFDFKDETYQIYRAKWMKNENNYLIRKL